jgi:hypothetical protein
MERKTLSAWLVYNWETKARKWYDWNEGFDKVGKLEPGEKLYFVSVELDPEMQFLEPMPHGKAKVTSVAYKTPTHVRGEGSWRKNLVGVVASLAAHAIPEGDYGPGNPLQTRYSEPGTVVMNVGDTTINISVDRAPGSSPEKP